MKKAKSELNDWSRPEYERSDFGDVGVWVKSFCHSSGAAKHYSNPLINNFSLAFVEEPNWNTITDSDAAIMTELWDSLQFLFDERTPPLESMICAGRPQKEGTIAGNTLRLQRYNH